MGVVREVLLCTNYFIHGWCRSSPDGDAEDILSRGDSQCSCAETPKEISREGGHGAAKGGAPAIDEKVRQLEMELEASSFYQVISPIFMPFHDAGLGSMDDA